MKRKQPTKSSPTFANPEMQQIEQLFQFMTEHNLEEFEYSRGDLHILHLGQEIREGVDDGVSLADAIRVGDELRDAEVEDHPDG